MSEQQQTAMDTANGATDTANGAALRARGAALGKWLAGGLVVVLAATIARWSVRRHGSPPHAGRTMATVLRERGIPWRRGSCHTHESTGPESAAPESTALASAASESAVPGSTVPESARRGSDPVPETHA